MKKIICIALLFVGIICTAQVDVSTGYSSKGLTTAQLNALPTVLKTSGLIIRNSDLDKLVTWDSDLEEFVVLGGGTTYTAGENLTLTGNEFALGSGINANKIADGSVSSTEFQYINSLTSNAQTQLNAKAEDNEVLKLTGNQTFSGVKTGYSLVLETELLFTSDNDEYWKWFNATVGSPGKLGLGRVSAPYSSVTALYSFSKTGTPTGSTDVTTKSYVDAALATAGTDSQTLSLSGTNNSTLGISGGNSVTIPNLGTFDFTTPAAATRRLIVGSDNVEGGRFNFEDSSGRVKMAIVSNDVAASSGRLELAETTTFIEESGSLDNNITLAFDFHSGADRNLVATPDDILYNGISLTGGGTTAASSVTVAATPSNYSAGSANVEAHLAGINTALGTISGGLSTDNQNKINNSFLPPKTLVKNSDYTLAIGDSYNNTTANSDIGRKYINAVNDGGTTIVTVNNIGSDDDLWRFRNETAASRFDIIPGTGVTFDWEGKSSNNAVRLTGTKGGLIFMRKTSSNNYFFDGDITGWAYSSVTNLFPTGNAASPTPDEANSTSGWSTADATVASTATSPQNGTHSIEITSTNNNGSDRAQITISGLDASKSYSLQYYAKTDGVSSNAFVQIEASLLDGAQYLQAITNTTTWTEYSGTINPNGTSIVLRCNAVNANGVGDIGDKLFIDNVRFIENP